MQHDSALVGLLDALGWHIAENPSLPGETLYGDYARGFLTLEREHDIQVARRSVRGAPSLKMWTRSPEAAQKYIAFFAARVLRWRSGRPDFGISIDPAAIPAPFVLKAPAGLQTRLEWGPGEDEWVEFGGGNEFAAVEFAQYGGGTVADTIAFVLREGPGASA